MKTYTKERHEKVVKVLRELARESGWKVTHEWGQHVIYKIR